jgi:hypothetical protein
MKLFKGIVAAVTAWALFGASVANAAIYHVDFEGGADTATGLTPQAAFKHAPGDRAATDAAKAVKLAPGDQVLFKGGVIYRGTLEVKVSGAPGKPIMFDGNTAGTFGTGRAIIDGADAVPGWKRCASHEEAGGNPRWAEIFYADVPKALEWRRANLCGEQKPLAIAQDPKPADPLFQESTETYHLVKEQLKLQCAATVTAEQGTRENPDRPLILLIAGRDSAVVDPLVGGSFTVNLPVAVKVSSVGLWPQIGYAEPREVVFYGDGKELLKAELKKGEKDIQKFSLAQPATFSKLTVKIVSGFDGDKGGFTAIQQVRAWTPEGKEVLAHPAHMTLTDPVVFTQAAPDYYKGMMLGFHGGSNDLLYLRVQGYDQATHQVKLDFFGGKQYPQTRYSLFNSVKLIGKPGEYSVEETAKADMSRVFLWPEKLEGGLPAGVGYGVRSSGFELDGVSDVVLQGFVVRRQGNGSMVCGIVAQGPGHDVTVRDCEITLVRQGTGMYFARLDRVLVERCVIHDNPGHSQGLAMHTCAKAVVKDCTLQRNTSTGLVYYYATDGEVSGNVILDHTGMHANGMSFYLDCRNILIERNYVARGHAALTLQNSDSITVRNNIFDSNGKSTVVGLWGSNHMKDVKFFYNCMLRSDPQVDWAAGLFTNSRVLDGLVVRNNIIDGLSSEGRFKKHKSVFSHNLYTREGADQKKGMLGENEILEIDLGKIFVDAAAGDFKLKPGSPALAAGRTVEGDGSAGAAGRAIDVGPFAMPPREKK